MNQSLKEHVHWIQSCTLMTLPRITLLKVDLLSSLAEAVPGFFADPHGEYTSVLFCGFSKWQLSSLLYSFARLRFFLFLIPFSKLSAAVILSSVSSPRPLF